MIRQRNDDGLDGGFTLIELVVVVMLIGILVAIAVPSWQGIQGAVRESATQSDLRSNRTAITEYSIDNNGAFPAAAGFDPSSAATDLTGYGWSRSAETTGFHYSTNTAGTAWCLDMTSATGSAFRITTNSPSAANAPTAEGLCSAVATSSY